MRLADPEVAYYGMPRRVAGERALIKQALVGVARGERFILGDRVSELEQSLRGRIGVRNAVAVSSGTSAVLLAMHALAVSPGQQVIVPAFGFHSSLTAVMRCRAHPTLVDVTSDGVIDPARAAVAMTARTRAVVAVHMFAATADMSALRALTRPSGAHLLENSAVAVGMRHAGRQAGTLGDLALFSFHPYKPLGGVSDGGAIVTDDDRLARSVRELRNHGQDGVTRFVHRRLGYNARMDEVGASVLLARLRSLDELLLRRAVLARRYDEAFADLQPGVSLPGGEPSRAGCYAYVLRCTERDALEEHLGAHGVESVVYYPYPLHLQPAFSSLGHRAGDFPCAERLCSETLALPLYPQLPDAELEHVIGAVRSFYGR
jgi:UDP-2-acetamido-2-deoxy-ribo-hexuluronate aminotransferase